MAEPHDMTFVAPEKRDEVTRRIEVIEDFLRTPGRPAASVAAAKLGLRITQFYNLVKAWRELRRPEALAGAGRPRSRRMAVTPEQSAFMDAVIAGNVRLPIRDLVNLAVERAPAAGIEIPPKEIVTRYMLRSRPSRLTGTITARLIVDHIVLDMGVQFPDGIVTRPLLSMIIDTRDEAIVGLALTSGAPTPAAAAAALLDALRRAVRSSGSQYADRPDVAYMPTPASRWPDLDDACSAVQIIARPTVDGHAHGDHIEALIGRQYNGLRLRPRLVVAGEQKRRMIRNGSKLPLTRADATKLAVGRIVGQRTTSAFSALDDLDRQHFESGLLGVMRQSRPA